MNVLSGGYLDEVLEKNQAAATQIAVTRIAIVSASFLINGFPY